MNNECTNHISQKIGIFTEIDYLVIVDCSCCLTTFFTLSIIDMQSLRLLNCMRDRIIMATKNNTIKNRECFYNSV